MIYKETFSVEFERAMPAPETAPCTVNAHPMLGHVYAPLFKCAVASDIRLQKPHGRYAHRQCDPFCSLRSIVRSMLASGTPGIAATFASAARARLQRSTAKAVAYPCPLFTRDSYSNDVVPTQQLSVTLAQARSLYGAGMGFASLR